MRKFFLLVLVATFSMYASATVKYPSTDISTIVNKANAEEIDVKNAKKIDFETFKEIAKSKGISKVVFAAAGFWHMDSCGGVYYVEYSGMTMFEARQVLAMMDPYFCAFPGYDWDITVYF